MGKRPGIVGKLDEYDRRERHREPLRRELVDIAEKHGLVAEDISAILSKSIHTVTAWLTNSHPTPLSARIVARVRIAVLVAGDRPYRWTPEQWTALVRSDGYQDALADYDAMRGASS
jgi:hypothetical protein